MLACKSWMFPSHVPSYNILAASQGVAGGIIVAPEGINGSICGTRGSIDAVLAFLRSDPRFASMRNTEGPGPAEAAPSPPPADKVRGNGWVGPNGEEWKATPFQRDRVNVKVKKEVSILFVGWTLVRR